MSLATILQGGVKTLNKITRQGGLQSTVQYAHPATTGSSGVTLGTPVTMHAHVDMHTNQTRTREGTEIAVRAILTLTDVDEIAAATGGQGISNDGVFTLKDGSVGPVLDLDGYVDDTTGKPYATTVMLG